MLLSQHTRDLSSIMQKIFTQKRSIATIIKGTLYMMHLKYILKLQVKIQDEKAFPGSKAIEISLKGLPAV